MTDQRATPEQAEEILRRPFDPTAGWEPRPQAAKGVLSARVDDEVSDWIYHEALARRISPSKLVAELLAGIVADRKAVAAGRARKVVDLDRLHTFLDEIAAAA